MTKMYTFFSNENPFVNVYVKIFGFSIIQNVVIPNTDKDNVHDIVSFYLNRFQLEIKYN